MSETASWPIETTVVTGWSRAGLEQYGRRMAWTFDKHWPRRVHLVSFVEDTDLELACETRVEQEMLDQAPGCVEFLVHTAEDDVARGHVPDQPKRWKGKDVAGGYNYRYDAHKFGRVAFYQAHVAEQITAGGGGFMAWFDGDTYTHRDVPDDWIESLLDGADAAYLGRGEKYPEVGFVAYRLPQALPLAILYRSAFEDGWFRDLDEWHSAWIFGHIIKYGLDPGIKVRDLTPGGRGHVWHRCDLGRYTDHLKGDRRKASGRSPEMRVA